MGNPINANGPAQTNQHTYYENTSPAPGNQNEAEATAPAESESEYTVVSLRTDDREIKGDDAEKAVNALREIARATGQNVELVEEIGRDGVYQNDELEFLFDQDGNGFDTHDAAAIAVKLKITCGVTEGYGKTSAAHACKVMGNSLNVLKKFGMDPDTLAMNKVKQGANRKSGDANPAPAATAIPDTFVYELENFSIIPDGKKKTY